MLSTKIIIENLRIFAFHGVLPQEKVLGNLYVINAEISANISKSIETDSLEDTINYAEINQIIHQEMKESSMLLEHVLGRIIKKIKCEFSEIEKIKIRITKTKPPMIGEMDGVTIEIEQKF